MKSKPKKTESPSPLRAALERVAEEITPDLSDSELEYASVELGHQLARVRAALKRALTAPTTRDRVVELAGQGLDNEAIAARLGIRADYVQRLRVAAGEREKGRPGRPSGGWEEELRPLLGQGLKVPEIARQLGWPATTTRARVERLEARERG